MERGGQELEEAGDDGCEGALLRKLSWNDMEAWTEFVQASCYTGKRRCRVSGDLDKRSFGYSHI